MPKLTAELFAQLPEEMQQDILQNVPAQHLSQIKVINAAEVDVDELTIRLQEILHSLSRRESLLVIVEMAKYFAEKTMPDDMPAKLQLAGSIELLESVVEHVRTIIKQMEGDEDGN